MKALTPTTTFRQQFLQGMASQAASLQYALLKCFDKNPMELATDSDLDIVIKRSELSRWKQLCRQAEGLVTVTVKDRYFVTYVALYFEDQSYLELDLLMELRRKQYVFMEADEVLKNANVLPSGWKLATDVDSFEYLFWFYGLNGAAVPQRYVAIFSDLTKGDTNAFINRFATVAPTGKKLLAGAATLALDARRLRAPSASNRFALRLLRWVQGIHNGLRRSEPVLTFSGVDGAGKSTIIERVKEMLTEKYRRKVVVLRHRPSLLPILSSYKYGKSAAEARAANTLPRQGQNQNPFSSALRFVYYFFDYLVGQFWVKWYHSMRGNLVVYDRYYYDFIVDGRRTNIALPGKWVKALLPFILKPRLNVLLYAAPEVIRKRKQELPVEAIKALTHSYKGLFEELDDRYSKAHFLCIENHDLADTLSQIETAFVTANSYA